MVQLSNYELHFISAGSCECYCNLNDYYCTDPKYRCFPGTGDWACLQYIGVATSISECTSVCSKDKSFAGMCRCN